MHHNPCCPYSMYFKILKEFMKSTNLRQIREHLILLHLLSWVGLSYWRGHRFDIVWNIIFIIAIQASDVCSYFLWFCAGCQCTEWTDIKVVRITWPKWIVSEYFILNTFYCCSIFEKIRNRALCMLPKLCLWRSDVWFCDLTIRQAVFATCSVWMDDSKHLDKLSGSPRIADQRSFSLWQVPRDATNTFLCEFNATF